MRFRPNELWGNRWPKCPYCKENAHYEKGWQNETFDLKCESCGKYFICEAWVEPRYCTVGSCEQNDEMPHELRKVACGVGSYYCIKCDGEVYDWELEGGKHERYTKDQYILIS